MSVRGASRRSSRPRRLASQNQRLIAECNRWSQQTEHRRALSDRQIFFQAGLIEHRPSEEQVEAGDQRATLRIAVASRKHRSLGTDGRKLKCVVLLEVAGKP